VLSLGQLGDEQVRTTSLRVYVLETHWSELVWHRTIVLPAASRVCEACKESVTF
jgi:hypothetical protein